MLGKNDRNLLLSHYKVGLEEALKICYQFAEFCLGILETVVVVWSKMTYKYLSISIKLHKYIHLKDCHDV